VTVTEWATVADLATALGTLILAVATFSSVRCATRATASRSCPAGVSTRKRRRRFLALPVNHPVAGAETGPGWLATASRHWSLDRPNRR